MIRSAPKGRQQMGETGFCKNLRFSAVSCENLRFPAVFYAPKSLDLQSEPKISENLHKSVKMCVPVSPFWRALYDGRHVLVGAGAVPVSAIWLSSMLM